MSRSIAPPVKAALAPFALVVAYVTIIAASPRVGFDTVGTLAASHLSRGVWFLAIFAGITLATILISNLLHRETRARPLAAAWSFLAKRWREDRGLSILVPPFYLALLLAGFSGFKQFILPAAGFGFDPLFAAIDRALFLGIDPWRVTHWLLPGAIGTRTLDIAYLLWFLPMMLGVLLSWAAPLRVRTQFLAAFALCWILLGTLLAYGLPGSGPCYFAALHGDPHFTALTERLAAQSDSLAAAGRGELLALRGQRELLDGFQTRELMLAGGISAMPSLHNALAVLFACAGFALNKTAGRVLAVFAAIIWFASIHLGWHYAVDGLVGGALALVIWRLADSWAARLLDGAQADPVLPTAAEPRPARS
jgi:hypothetical protein